MQLDFLENLLSIPPLDERVSKAGVLIGQTKLPLDIVRNRRAKRYIIRLLPELVLRVTIPRGGSKKEALRFVSENLIWIEKQFQSHRLKNSFKLVNQLSKQSAVFYQGRLVPFSSSSNITTKFIRFADLCIPKINIDEESYKATIEKFLYGLAKSTLAERTQQLANRHCFKPNRISIRNQKTRWGSCSNSKTISLNWRLIQVPAFVRDYVILHELVHLEYLDHSPSFWTRLNQLCHNLQAAELWLNEYSQQV